MYCDNCGASLGAGLKFCSSCGNKVQATDSSRQTSQGEFASERRRSSSQKLQTAILISIPALLLIIAAAWLIIPNTFQSTTIPTRQPGEQSAPKPSAHIDDPLSPSNSDVQ